MPRETVDHMKFRPARMV